MASYSLDVIHCDVCEENWIFWNVYEFVSYSFDVIWLMTACASTIKV